MHHLTYNFAYHVDSTTLADGDYELIPNQDVEKFLKTSGTPSEI
jgi:hypothetical protein